MNKILYIVGPTATGKTSMALSIASNIDADIISADSRQVYKGMDIGTGKDIPKSFKKETILVGDKKHTIYKNNTVSIWGYDQADPTDQYSIAHFYNFTIEVIKHIHEQGRLPIIVGGTGIYLNAIENPPESISIPLNKSLRKELYNLSVSELKRRLSNLDINKFNSMNNSDANNPRRLVRAIEICVFKEKNLGKTPKINKYESLWVGLKLPLASIDKKIESRVDYRIKAGFGKEFDTLFKKGQINKDFQSSSSTGYRQWLDYYQKNITKGEARTNWITAEKQYARRQLTWFKKKKNINWYDVDEKNARKSIVEFVRFWYS